MKPNRLNLGVRLAMIVLVFSIGLASCSKTEEQQTTTQTPTGDSSSVSSASETKTAIGDGRVVAISPDRSSITINHGQIGDLMEAMEMPFDVARRDIVNDINIGDSINFTIEYSEAKGYVLTRVQKR